MGSIEVNVQDVVNVCGCLLWCWHLQFLGREMYPVSTMTIPKQTQYWTLFQTHFMETHILKKWQHKRCGQ